MRAMIAFASVLTAALPGAALAGGSISEITQVAVATPTLATVTQTGPSGSTSAISQISVLTPDVAPFLAVVAQSDLGGLPSGEANKSRIVQGGFTSGAFATVQQANTAAGAPGASANRSDIRQGDPVLASINASAGVLQFGEGNSAEIVQGAGFEPAAAITQTGSHNSAAIHQSNVNLAQAQTLQIGNGNTATIMQSGRLVLGPSGLSAGIAQTGDHNQAHVLQDGFALVADVLQENAGNTVHIAQSSTGPGPSIVDVIQQ